jgi:F0F1-type ATP synthase assembly protein I
VEEKPPGNKDLGFYFALSQVGFEMVAPLAVGVVLDHYFGWAPWGAVVGFGLGFVGGFAHLMVMVKQHEADRRRQPPGGETR